MFIILDVLAKEILYRYHPRNFRIFDLSMCIADFLFADR
ncbi:hypothetical protein SSYIS1_06640 [Serratia symbiotica]|uniref:Uncharacterized protein n=1 Tax=Serratia symbiotica TaxID=138074 RepID=A0A455VN92_9GAMM|nr:hypothetical protein SSYIS1_06640 [Serratia symbiotica]